MLKKFFSDSALYILASLFTKGIGFLMLPIYLLYLDKAAFGMFDYITAVGAFVGVIVALEISQSVIRYSSEYNDCADKQREFIANGFWFGVFCYAFLILFSIIFLENVSYFFTDSSENKVLAFLAVISFFSTALTYMVSVIYRSKLNAKAATLSSAASALMVAILNVIIFHYFELGLIGVFIAIILGQVAVFTVNAYRLRYFLIPTIDLKILKKMLKFSTPLVFSSFGVVLATLADRFMIKEMLSFEDVGAYAVAARFSMILSLITVGFQNSLAPLIYSNLNDKNLKRNLKRILLLYVTAALLGITFMLVLIKPIILLVAGVEYLEAAQIAVLLSCAVLINSLYIFFPGLTIIGKTGVIAVINIASGVLNVILNYYFISRCGVIGAAIATILSTIVYVGLNITFSERYFPLFFNRSKA